MRGYLAGSGWKDYQKTGSVCGIALPPGLRESDRLPEPIFTPDDEGGDRTRREHVVRRGGGRARRRRAPPRCATSASTCTAAGAAHAETRGIILADTKFEFGVKDGRLVWIDEALTPDSSRFWPGDTLRARAGPRRASTSSTSGTTSRPWTGTRSRRRLPFRRRWSTARARSTKRRWRGSRTESEGR